MEESKRTTTHIGYLSSSTKNKRKKILVKKYVKWLHYESKPREKTMASVEEIE